MPSADAFFLPFRQGRRFCLLHSVDADVARRGAILYVHPFAEEMNRSRHMVAMQARALAAAGWAVLQFDLFGCGDSDGDFGEADWATWVGDVVEAATWFRSQVDTPIALWGLRAGCLLAAEAARNADLASDLLLWQPVVSGKQYLRQFLRLKLTAQIVGTDSRQRTTVESLQAQWARGEALEIAGYELSPALASGLDAARFAVAETIERVAWLEVTEQEDGGLTPSARSCLGVLQARGGRVFGRAVAGPPFWQTQQIAESPALIKATTAVVEEWRG